MTPQFSAIDTVTARKYQSGQKDVYGNFPENAVSDGAGNPCRHCMHAIPEGAGMLILAYRPFDGLHAYAETGPIFLCADQCAGFEISYLVPPILRASPDYLIKGYSGDGRIVYGTGEVVRVEALKDAAISIFDDPEVAYIHVRSARNNCYLARIDRG